MARGAFSSSWWVGSAAVAATAAVVSVGTVASAAAPLRFGNPDGKLGTLSTLGPIDSRHPFFQPLGPTGRACSSCHDPSAGWSLSPALAEQRFAASGGLDPLFRPHDGANSPAADTSTVAARRLAYSMLLRRGVFRIGLPVPQGAELTLVTADDPYGHASASELSLFRRPLPAANLQLTSRVMWDGRDTQEGGSLEQSLLKQALGALQGHHQIGSPDPAVVEQLVRFEGSLVAAQEADRRAGALGKSKGKGGAAKLAKQLSSAKVPEMTDFKLFQAWKKGKSGKARNRAAIARGEKLFNAHRFTVSDVRGFNDVLGQPVVSATCSSCHQAPDGASRRFQEMDLGVSAGTRRAPEQPLYTFRHTFTGEVRSTTDPGRALVTGKWDDMDKFKVPSLRGLASRPPYLHDGSAADLDAVVQFYEDRFRLQLTAKQRSDLLAFLRSL
ncbi:MAG: hypothetical protein ACK47B_06140 [Armatimonadota bacterium]